VGNGCLGTGLAESALCWIAAALRAWSPTERVSGGLRRSPRCGGSGSPARRSPNCSTWPARPCRGSSRGSGWVDWAASGFEPAERYERERPGELVHIDGKKLGRIQGGAGKRVTGVKRNPNRTRWDHQVGFSRKLTGWEYVHIAIDDATRLAYAEVLSDEKASTAIGFLGRAVAFYARHGVSVERVMTDNGSPYRSAIHALACRTLGIRHLRTRPRRPQTNGTAERFIRTMLAGWAYGAIYRDSRERTAALDGWLWTYNHRRRHSAIARQPPITRLNNLLGSYT
jgi:transposase InsO family protein